jgi:preprotein translocase SecE subunit
LATKDKKPAAKKSATTTKVTRITANDTSTKAAKKETVTSTVKPVRNGQPRKSRSIKGAARPFVGLGQYFKGAWYELKQVSWPTRRATWSLTAAMLAFTGIFVVVILLLDALFKYLFQLILA